MLGGGSTVLCVHDLITVAVSWTQISKGLSLCGVWQTCCYSNSFIFWVLTFNFSKLGGNFRHPESCVEVIGNVQHSAVDPEGMKTNPRSPLCALLLSVARCVAGSCVRQRLLQIHITFIPFWEHTTLNWQNVCVGGVYLQPGSNLPPNPALHNETQAELRAGYPGPPWYCTTQYILTCGSLLGLDLELGFINGVDV